MQQSFDLLLRTAEAWAELQTGQWLTHQRLYGTSLQNFRNTCAKQGVPIHLSGDYPLLARFGSNVADSLVEAIRGLDWAAYDQPVPTSARAHPIVATTTATEVLSHTSSTFETSGFDLDDDDMDDDDSDDDYVGRRATRAEHQAMSRLGLSALQICRVKLMIWQRHPTHWHDRLRVILKYDHRLVFSLLGQLES